MDNKTSSRSWFCVLNNPSDCYEGEPNQIAEKVLAEWVDNHISRSGAVAYCISADGLHHLHMVLEDNNKSRFSAVKKAYPKAHIEPTMGTKEQAEDYINKRGKFVEKGEIIIYIARYGEIKGRQGSRKDLEIIEQMLNEGRTPNQIYDANFSYRRYSTMIKEAYYDKRKKDTPFIRDVVVYWHVGESGSGKSYVANTLIEQYGENEVYFVTDYDNGGFDRYNGEKYLFLDEFRGQIKFQILLNMLDKYKATIHSRYTNIVSLWYRVDISSVLPPDKVYERMVSDDRNLDTVKQLFRRINYIVYHYKTDNGEYKTFELPMEEYKNYDDLKYRAIGNKFLKIQDDEVNPFMNPTT